MILELLKSVCTSLNAARIPYMISGSVALNIYTVPRMTRDIDIVIELDDNRVDEFTTLFPHSYYNLETIRAEVHKRGMFNIIDHESGFKIDFIVRKDTTYFNMAFSRRLAFNEFDTTIWVISIEDLIIAKLIWAQDTHSEKQIEDIQNLLLNPNKDMDYIKGWTNYLGLSTFTLY